MNTWRRPSTAYASGISLVSGWRTAGRVADREQHPGEQELRHEHERDELDDLELGPRERREEDAQAHRPDREGEHDEEGDERAAGDLDPEADRRTRAAARWPARGRVPRAQVMRIATWIVAKTQNPMV